jgi:hypothetical protein
MSGITLHPTESSSAPQDLAAEITRVELILAERKAELAKLQDELREFKSIYTNLVGSRLASLAEIEREIKVAEERILGVEVVDEEVSQSPKETTPSPARTSLRKLFWSVAKMFHPDHATDEKEAQRRHTVMAEASRAYRDGDFESLQTLLGEEELQFFCTSSQMKEETLADHLWALKDELRTIEFGIKRIRQDALFRMKAQADEASASGRNPLAEEAERLDRRIAKARKRLEHFS